MRAGRARPRWRRGYGPTGDRARAGWETARQAVHRSARKALGPQRKRLGPAGSGDPVRALGRADHRAGNGLHAGPRRPRRSQVAGISKLPYAYFMRIMRIFLNTHEIRTGVLKMPSAYFMRISCVFHAYFMRIPCVLHAFCMRISCVFQMLKCVFHAYKMRFDAYFICSNAYFMRISSVVMRI